MLIKRGLHFLGFLARRVFSSVKIFTRVRVSRTLYFLKENYGLIGLFYEKYLTLYRLLSYRGRGGPRRTGTVCRRREW